VHLVCDIECDNLSVPDITNVWCVVTKNIETEEVRVFRELNDELKLHLSSADSIIGHNFIDYDYSALDRFIPGVLVPRQIVDTLVLSRLLKYKLDDGEGHSLEAWGNRFSLPKHASPDWKVFSEAIVDRCVQDVEINYQLYNYLYEYLKEPYWQQAIHTEMEMAWICKEMSDNGFRYDKAGADALFKSLEERLQHLDTSIIECFPPRLRAVREITPKLTKHGTISKANLPRDWTDLTRIFPGCPFTLVRNEVFNPGSTRQLVERLDEAGWKPVDRTKTGKGWKVNEVNLATLPATAPEGARKLVERLLLAARVRTLTEWAASYNPKTERVHGKFNSIGTWPGRMSHSKPNLGNVATKKSIKYKSSYLKSLALDYGAAMRSLWVATPGSWLVDTINVEVKDCQIGLGEAMTIRNITMSITNDGQSVNAHSKLLIETLKEIEGYDLNTAELLKTLIEWLQNKKVNVSSVVKKEKNYWLIIATRPEGLGNCYADIVTQALDGLKIGSKSFLITSKKQEKAESFLVGTDMEAAHVRLFAHYIDDPVFTKAVVSGNKKDGTDVHTVGAKIFQHLGCDRDNHKTFIFSFFNGAGPPKVAEIFGCSIGEARKALDLYAKRFPGIRRLREELIPIYARQGWFPGLDGRRIVYTEEHGMFAGMLQAGEACVMKMANIIWRKELNERGVRYKQVNLVHDEYVTEVSEDEAITHVVGRLQSDAIRRVGDNLGLRCPLAGEYKIGKTWLAVH
jgi:DNA polymerase I-like protein with 3'-5' exonuclease and polymerase domains